MDEGQPPLTFNVLPPLDTETIAPEQLYGLMGEDGIIRMVAAFYQQVPQDEILGPMYPEDDLDGSETRLRNFLIFRFGGPTHYLEQRGHPRLRMRHAPFPLDQRARDRWVALMDKAIDQVALPSPVATAVRKFLHETATFLINRHPAQ